MYLINDYSDYELKIKYYIIWYLDLNRKLEQEVDAKTFAYAVNDIDKEKYFPYSFKLKYFIKTQSSDFLEVSKELYAEIYKWQHNDKFHYIYEARKHRVDLIEADITDFADEFSLEDYVIEKIETEYLMRKLRKLLNSNQFDIVKALSFDEKNQSEIAREKELSRQAVGNSLTYIKNKLKNIF